MPITTQHPELGIAVVTVDAGQAKEIVWRFGRDQDVEFACNIPGHYEDGMKGPIRFVK